MVTGGATGIGWAIAGVLGGEGCRVVIASRRQGALDEAEAAWLHETPLLTHTVDVADQRSVAALFDWAGKELGQVDILVNSAGINIPQRTMAGMPDGEWERIININASGAFYCMRQVLPAMRKRKDGLIINISSISGIRAGDLGGVAYCASKFAMSGLGLAVANECRHEGVRITNIYPGEVDTPILMNRPSPVTQEHRDRIMKPEDFCDLVLAICLLPPRTHVPELVIKPTVQEFV